MTTNGEWLFSKPFEEQVAWMNAEHVQQPVTDASERVTKQAEMLHMPESPTSGEMVAELQAQVDKLTAERDKLQEQLRIGWECECRLQAERDHYRSKFGKCIDYADAIHALMDDEGMA